MDPLWNEPEPSAETEPLLPGLPAVPAGALRDPGIPSALRVRVMEATLRSVRRRLALRRARAAAAVLLAFAAGWWGARIAGPAVPGASPSAPAPAPAAAAAPDPLDVAQAPLAAPGEARAASDPRALEDAAREADGPRRYRLLKEAGDRYLSLRGDVEGALRCYRRALGAVEPPEPFRTEPGDSWLFTALVASRT